MPPYFKEECIVSKETVHLIATHNVEFFFHFSFHFRRMENAGRNIELFSWDWIQFTLKGISIDQKRKKNRIITKIQIMSNRARLSSFKPEHSRESWVEPATEFNASVVQVVKVVKVIDVKVMLNWWMTVYEHCSLNSLGHQCLYEIENLLCILLTSRSKTVETIWEDKQF